MVRIQFGQTSTLLNLQYNALKDDDDNNEKEKKKDEE